MYGELHVCIVYQPFRKTFGSHIFLGKIRQVIELTVAEQRKSFDVVSIEFSFNFFVAAPLGFVCAHAPQLYYLFKQIYTRWVLD